MRTKKIYPILILTVAMSLIITYGISEGKFKTYAFTEIFADESFEAENSAAEEEPLQIAVKDIKARLTLKELMYHSEKKEEDYEITKDDEYISNEGAVKKQVATSRGGFRFKNEMDMAATAYDLSYESCGKYPDHPEYGITASGTKAQPGTVAVDPDVIPLGTKLYIASTDGSPDYGFATALDTGSAIKGYRVDLFMEDNQEALDFGRRQVKVYILE